MSTGPSKSARPTPAGELAVRTERRTQLLDVTAAVAKMVQDSGVQSGICYLYVPHTTAGVIINENADPDVAADMEAALARLVPKDAGYDHAEGNSDSHIKTALVGTSATIFHQRRPTRARPLARRLLLRIRRPAHPPPARQNRPRLTSLQGVVPRSPRTHARIRGGSRCPTKQMFVHAL
jgi:secondary thiamine-phosphate synthase enzyme